MFSLYEFIGGVLFGYINVIVGHPLDTIKVLSQVNNNNINNKHYNLRLLYRGIIPPLLTVPIQNALVFSSYHKACEIFDVKKNDKNYMKIFVSGGYAGIFYSILSTPMELIKIRSQTNLTLNMMKKNILNIYNSNGFFGLYKGFGITLIRETLAFSTQFTVYEYMKVSLKNEFNINQNNNLLLTAIAGGTSGIGAWTVSYIPDIIKTAKQNNNNQSSIMIFRNIIKKNGYRGLFKGYFPCITRTIIVDSIGFSVFETYMNY